jgi:hypothetical protein
MIHPSKVIFGFCISDCGPTGSNANAAQAVQVMSDLKTLNNAEFACNGGAFFWVAYTDINGQWSDAVVAEVQKTAGCSNPTLTPTTAHPTDAPTTLSPSTTGSPSNSPSISHKPTKTPTTKAPRTTKPSMSPTRKPSLSPTAAPPCGACAPGDTGNYPTVNCYGFVQCILGVLAGIVSCPAGTIFDVRLGVCNWSYAATCECMALTPPPPPPGPSPPVKPPISFTPTTQGKKIIRNTS